jgi:hypothetical protein
MPMPFEFHEICPYLDCDTPHRVYVHEEAIPTDMAYLYYCPRCLRRVVSRPTAFIVGVEIPSGAIVAERFEATK